MKPLIERLNDHIERTISQTRQHGQSGFMQPTSESEHDPEIDKLVTLARSLQAAPQLQATPDFTRELERRLLRRQTELKLQQTGKKRPFFPPFRVHFAFGAILGLCLVFLVLSSGVFALAANVSNPANPLYSLKRLEQHFQVSLAGNPEDKASLELQYAREQLNALPTLTDANESAEYLRALNDLDEHVNLFASAINQLPAGSHRDQLAGQLVTLKSDAITELRKLLPRLTIAERLATTNELQHLGDTVPQLTDAKLALPAHPGGNATIDLYGNGIQSGAQLLVDGRIIEASGTLQSGHITFVVAWNGDEHPHSLGIVNPDGTTTEITTITITTTNPNDNTKGNKNNTGGNGNNNNNSNGNNNGNGGNHNKPETTPVPRH